MSNNNFFSNTSIAPVKNLEIMPYPTRQINSAILYSAADRPTQQKLAKEALSDQCRALLAYTAMENTLMLSALEMQCYLQAPQGEQRYKAIVDAYTAGAVKRIVGW